MDALQGESVESCTGRDNDGECVEIERLFRLPSCAEDGWSCKSGTKMTVFVESIRNADFSLQHTSKFSALTIKTFVAKTLSRKVIQNPQSNAALETTC